MSELSRRTVLRAAGAMGLSAAALTLLAACGGRAIPLERGGRADLQFWTHDPGYINTFNAAIADPAIAGALDWDYSLTAVQAAGADLLPRPITQPTANGTVPDLLGLIIDQFPRVMTRGIAEELFVDLSPIVSGLGDSLVKTAPYSVDGRLYALESDLSATVQYYRSDVFEENGLPTDAATWDDWLDIGEELNAKTGQYIGLHSNGDNGSIFNSFLQLLLQRGRSPYDAEGRFTLESDEAVEVLQFMQDGVARGAFTMLSDPYGSAVAAALKGGDLAAIAMPSWYNDYGLQANVPDQAGLWRIRTLPVFSGGGHRATTLGGTAFAVTRDRANTEPALELLKQVYLTREGQLLRYRQGGFLPTLRDLYSDPEFLAEENAFLGGQRAFEVYADAAQDIPEFNQSADIPILTTVAGQPILAVLQGDIAPEEGLERIVRAYREQVE